jgi:hypothetical protein
MCQSTKHNNTTNAPFKNSAGTSAFEYLAEENLEQGKSNTSIIECASLYNK